MNISEKAKAISKKTKQDSGLLYLLPSEIQKAINEKRIIFFQKNDDIIAFCIWIFHGEWCEINALYVDPQYRRLGYFFTIINRLKIYLAPSINKAFIVTRHPAVARAVKAAGFQEISFFKLPWLVQLRLLFHRLNIQRIFSYLKLLPLIFKIKMRIFIFQKPT